MPNAAIHLQASQGAAMSARMQHGLKMLQMSALELEQEVAALLADNPLLERPEEAGDERPVGPWSEARSGGAVPDDDGEASTPAAVSLREHLLQQVAVSALSAHDAAMARVVVEALDEDGYLRDDPAEILAALAQIVGQILPFAVARVNEILDGFFKNRFDAFPDLFVVGLFRIDLHDAGQ
mgnify:CR=1 FL=1